MVERALDVFCFGRRAGMLRDLDPTLEFAYDEQWLADGLPPLSQSLPVEGGWAPGAPLAFFGGLLPEGRPRATLSRLLGVSVGNDFGLLRLLGGDCAGAVSLHQPGALPAAPGDGADVTWLDDEALAATLAELPSRPLRADASGEARLSLAGAQDKLPVVVDNDGRIGVTQGVTPSTHIVKTPIDGLDGTVANEAFCLLLGRELGLETVQAEPSRIGGSEFLLIRRYDREAGAEGVLRLHQEDACQALGVAAERKYEAEGGPSLANCFALLRSATRSGRHAVVAREAPKLLDAWTLSFLVGNHDAHGKNFSLLYRPDSVTLAPIYDVLSTVVYWKVKEMDRRMAMRVGGESRPRYVRPRHLAAMLHDCGLAAAPARRRIARLAHAAPAAARSARDALPAAFAGEPVLERIVTTVDERAGWLQQLTAAPPIPSSA
jgi:serine/threonine-protein kinase HipA